MSAEAGDELIVEVIPPALAGERLDRIVSLVTGASRADAAVLVSTGGASVDGEVVTSGKIRLTEGQEVELDPAFLPQPQLPQPDPTVEVRVVHVDDDVIVIDKHENGGYVTPHEAAGEDATFISRIREDATVENGLAFWCVSDNLRKGAALNAVQIAEALVKRKLIAPKKG
jgi:23S rRNA-/tRNA-specific pseudouridylate synthase